MSNMPANVRISAQFPFPAGVAGTTPIAITKVNGIWSVALPLDALATQNPSGGSLTTDYVLVWDSLTGTYFKMPISNIPTGPPGPPGAAGPPGPSGGITDAPSDGVNYGRKNAAWNNLDTIYAPIAAAAPLDALAYNGMQINGSMDVSQELGGAGLTIPNGSNLYVADGWRCYSNNGATRSINAQQITTPGTPPFGLALTNSLQIKALTGGSYAAAGDMVIFFQLIEGYRFRRMGFGQSVAQPVTIAFWVYATVAGTLALFVQNGATNRSYVADVVVNAPLTWEYKTVTVPGDVTGTWDLSTGVGAGIGFCVTGSGANRATPNTWTAANAPCTANTTNFLATTNNVICFTGVIALPGIEAPSAARSPFIMRPFDQELATCKRYLQVFRQDLVLITTAASAQRYDSVTPWPHGVMRAAPTVTYSNFTYGNASALTNNGSTGALWARYMTVSGAGLAYVYADLVADARL